MNDIMIDLETLGTCNNAAILTIGACRFDIETGEIGQTFQIGIEPENTIDYGEIDAETVLWWMIQTVSAKAEILNTLRDNIHGYDPKKEIPFVGTEHNALHDAIHQARYVSAIYQRISGHS